MQAVEMRGNTVRFKGNGRKLGYPTANLTVTSSPEDGVYFGYATLDQYNNHPALIFIGIPTTMGDKDRRVEVHLLDIPDKDYYNLPLSITVNEFHRPNRTFNSVDELVEAMKHDESAARQWFANRSND